MTFEEAGILAAIKKIEAGNTIPAILAAMDREIPKHEAEWLQRDAEWSEADRTTPAGWWILPGAILGGVILGAVIVAALRWMI